MFSLLKGVKQIRPLRKESTKTNTNPSPTVETRDDWDENVQKLSQENVQTLSQEHVRKLSQENQQLRRELQDAMVRIRELEANLAKVYIANADDDSSVEVQSVDLSTTSSLTTIPVGSPLSNRERERHQQRDDRVTRKNSRKADKVCRERRRINRTMDILSLKEHRDPPGFHAPTPSYTSRRSKHVPSILADLFESDSSDSVFEEASCSSISEADVREAKRVNDRYGMRYGSETSLSLGNTKGAETDDSGIFSADDDESIFEI